MMSINTELDPLQDISIATFGIFFSPNSRLQIFMIQWCFYISSLILTLFLSPSILALETGDKAPGCNDNSKQLLDLPVQRGNIVYLDFWATWCLPCKKSMPFLNELHNTLSSRGFTVIAVNVDEDPEDAKKYLAKHPVDYPVIFDPEGKCPEKYQVMAMPSSYLIDQNGTIRDIHLGFRLSDREDIRTGITNLLNRLP